MTTEINWGSVAVILAALLLIIILLMLQWGSTAPYNSNYSCII